MSSLPVTPRITRSETILAEMKVSPILLNSYEEIDRIMRKILSSEKMRVEVVSHRFHPWGLTIVYVLGASHIALHTYPENRGLSVDIHICEGDIFALYDKIRKAFNALDADYVHFVRSNAEPHPFIYTQSGRWFDARVAPGLVRRIEASRVLYEGRTRLQTIHIIENPTLGKVLFLDGDLQFCEADVDTYGRMITMGFKEFRPKTVLILGGGEGQVAKYILQHYPFVEHIKIVEIDGEAVEIYKRFFDTAEILRNGKVELVIQNAFDFVRNTNDRYGAIVLDFTTRPINIPMHAFYKEFFGNLVRLSDLITLFAPVWIGHSETSETRLLRRVFRQFGYKVRFRSARHIAWQERIWYGMAYRVKGS
jgi:spermidine synthase